MNPRITHLYVYTWGVRLEHVIVAGEYRPFVDFATEADARAFARRHRLSVR